MDGANLAIFSFRIDIASQLSDAVILEGDMTQSENQTANMVYGPLGIFD